MYLDEYDADRKYWWLFCSRCGWQITMNNIACPNQCPQCQLHGLSILNMDQVELEDYLKRKDLFKCTLKEYAKLKGIL